MKTTIFLLIGLFISVSAVSAKTSGRVVDGDQPVQIQNAGQDKKIEVQNMTVLEDEVIDEVDQPEIISGEIINTHGQQVSEQVRLLLQSKLASQSGIGEQVRQIAQKQKQAQQSIQSGLAKINARPGWFKKLFGSNQTAVKNLNQQMEQNQLRIEELAKFQNEVSNQADYDMIQNTITTLTEQNTALVQALQSEQKFVGIFSWLRTLLNR